MGTRSKSDKPQSRVTTHGAASKGTSSGRPVANRGGSHAQNPATNVGPGNCYSYAFPSTGGMRKMSGSDKSYGATKY